MAGVVKDGILQVNTSGGGGTPVSITGPLGSQPAASSVSVALASDQIPLPISGSVSVTGPVDVTGSDVSIVGSVAVTGPLTDVQLRATPVPVSISSGISNPLPVSVASLPLPANAAQESGGNLDNISAELNHPATTITTQVNPSWRQSTVLLATNLSRKQALINNLTDAPFYLNEGAAASEISYVLVVPPRSRYESDGTMGVNAYWNVLPTSGFVFATERM